MDELQKKKLLKIYPEGIISEPEPKNCDSVERDERLKKAHLSITDKCNLYVFLSLRVR